jgi:phage FluMu protein Com
MKELRCNDCGRFLCKLAFGEVEIKCPNSKCKAVNHFRVDSYKQLLTAKLEGDSIKV